MSKLVLASTNAGKLREIRALCSKLDLDIEPQSNWRITEVEETGRTFVENAILKARHAATHTQLPAIADDSGLIVDALGNAPGVHSARFAGAKADDNDNVRLLIERIKPVPEKKRAARFICVIVSLQHADDPLPIIASGQWDGVITETPQGVNGFGYDPIFHLPDHQCTAAELPATVKNAESHRARAFTAWVARYRARYI